MSDADKGTEPKVYVVVYRDDGDVVLDATTDRETALRSWERFRAVADKNEAAYEIWVEARAEHELKTGRLDCSYYRRPYAMVQAACDVFILTKGGDGMWDYQAEEWADEAGPEGGVV